jgi:hypothetical protein
MAVEPKIYGSDLMKPKGYFWSNPSRWSLDERFTVLAGDRRRCPGARGGAMHGLARDGSATATGLISQ